MDNNRSVTIIDDDQAIRDALVNLFEAAGHSVRAYASAEDYLADTGSRDAGCLVLDVRLPGMSGLDLQRRLVSEHAPVAIIMMTGHGDIPMAVAAVKEGALEFVEKPFSPASLLESVRTALAASEQLDRDHAQMVEVRARYDTLSPRERQVMALLLEGQATKMIARALDISPRTAETHRARVMEKMGASSLSVLVKQALFLDQLSAVR